MQKYQLVILICSCLNLVNAQSFYESFYLTEVIPCPFDSTAQVEWPEGWSVYHTKNNLWDGKIDSAWCLSVEFVVAGFSRHMYLNAEEIDGERPVFFRYRDLQTNAIHLPADMLYTLETGFELYDQVSLIVGNTFPPSSGVLLNVDIPAEDSIGRDIRTRYYEFQDTIDWITSTACFASEKFSDQYLNDIVLTFSFRHPQTKGHLIELSHIYLSSVYEFGILSQHSIDPQWWSDTSYRIPLWALTVEPSYYLNYILPYTAPTYPSTQHISFFELAPVAAADSAQTLTVVIDPDMSLIPELFTAFRGGLVSMGDTLRHRVEVMNNGGNLCIQWIEITFEDDTKYLHKAGSIEMRGDASCMMFKSGAAFEMAEAAKLEYGRSGMGFLAMKQGSHMILREHAELTINNTLVLQLSSTTNHTDPTVFLYPGSSLRFSREGNLEAWGSADLRLRVMMLGGILDVSTLTEAERALIEMVYPEKTGDLARGDLMLVKDNARDALRIYVHVNRELTGTISITDVSGHTVIEQSTDFNQGNFYYAVDLQDLPIGWFVASVRTGDSYLSAPFTHLR